MGYIQQGSGPEEPFEGFRRSPYFDQSIPRACGDGKHSYIRTDVYKVTILNFYRMPS
jgi:hypothetical protein